jgi:hypothetical protein
LALAYGLTAEGKTDAAEPILRELIEFSTANGAEFLGATARFFQELGCIGRMDPAEGLLFMESQLDSWRRNGSWLRYAICCQALARTYAHLATESEDPMDLGGRLPGKAEQWYRTCIETARAGNMRLLQAQSWLGLAELHHAAHRGGEARKVLDRSIALLTACGAEVYLARARALCTSLQSVG